MANFVKHNVQTIEEFYHKSNHYFINKLSETKKIELAGRTCYNSYDKINDTDSDINFCRNMIKSGHEAMIEFGHIIISVDEKLYFKIKEANFKYLNLTSYNNNFLVSGNIRAWRNFIKNADALEQAKEYLLYKFKFNKDYKIFFEDIDWNYDVNISNVSFTKFDFELGFNLTKEEKLKHQYFHFIIEADRAVLAELTRHRESSFAVQSQRYVNYKNGVEFIFPHWYDKKVKGIVNKLKHVIGKYLWTSSCKYSESYYKWLIRLGYKPQDARSVLPNATKTIINIAGNLENFEWIFHLRSAKSAHPDIRIISDKMQRIINMDK